MGVEVHRIELKQVGLPRQMQRSMAGEAEARVQAQAKLVTFQGETEANNRLVEAGGSLVSKLIIYLNSISTPVSDVLRGNLAD